MITLIERYERVELMPAVFMDKNVFLLQFVVGIYDCSELERQWVLDVVGAWSNAQGHMLSIVDGQNLSL